MRDSFLVTLALSNALLSPSNRSGKSHALQGWLGRSDTPLYEGLVQLVRWSDSLVAWGSAKAVTFYDTNSHCQVRTVTRYPPPPRKPAGGVAAAAAHAQAALAAAPPSGQVSILFGQNARVYISWPDCIKVWEGVVG